MKTFVPASLTAVRATPFYKTWAELGFVHVAKVNPRDEVIDVVLLAQRAIRRHRLAQAPDLHAAA